MFRMFLFSGALVVFLIWSAYKLLVDKKTTQQDITDIKLGLIFVAVFVGLLYWLFN